VFTSDHILYPPGEQELLLKTVDDAELSVDDDLADVLDAIETLAADWRKLAVRLRLKDSSMEVIQANHPGDCVSCLSDAIKDWLKMNYNVQRHGVPSWRSLVQAVAHVDKALALHIADEHRGV